MATPLEMDQAAIEAATALKEIDEAALTTVAQWWNEWFRKAGHKRLGRVLASVSKEGLGILEHPELAITR